MSWKDRLTWAEDDDLQKKKASFREATFFVRGSDYGLGRRNVVHQYPQKEVPFVEDLGADVDDFNITGYVVQNLDNGLDYIAERDALINALRTKGPGKLIHPFYGEMQVSLVGRARISEVFTEGGIARFSMSFVRVEEQQVSANKAFPANTGLFFNQPFRRPHADPVNAVDTEVDKSSDKALDGHAKVYNDAWQIPSLSSTPPATPVSTPNYVNVKIQDSIDSLRGMLNGVTGAIQGAFPSQITNAINILSEEYGGIDLDTVRDVCSLGSSVIGMFNGLLSLSGQFGDIVASQLFGVCSGAVRGLNSGPFSGAEIGFSADSIGSVTSPLDKDGQPSEDYGKSVVSAILQINRFGEDVGGDDPSIYGGTLEPININTTQRAKQAANINALINLARVHAILYAMKTAVRIKYQSYESTITVTDEIIDALDDLLLKLGDDAADIEYDTYGVTIADSESYESLVAMRAVFIQAMIDIGADLARVINYVVPPITTSSLVTAYNLYEDIDREQEIITRNLPTVKHPGFLPGGEEIEVLSE